MQCRSWLTFAVSMTFAAALPSCTQNEGEAPPPSATPTLASDQKITDPNGASEIKIFVGSGFSQCGTNRTLTFAGTKLKSEVVSQRCPAENKTRETTLTAAQSDTLVAKVAGVHLQDAKTPCPADQSTITLTITKEGKATDYQTYVCTKGKTELVEAEIGAVVREMGKLLGED